MPLAGDRFAFVAARAAQSIRSPAALLVMGSPGVRFERSALLALAARHGALAIENGKFRITPDHPVTGFLATDPETVADEAIYAALGFAPIDRIEPGADARDGGRRYDMIVDNGALARCFHVPATLTMLYEVLNDGGCIVHANPLNNAVDDGFFQFCPTFFLDYYNANAFDVLDAVIAAAPGTAGEPAFQHRYDRSAAALRHNPYLGNYGGRPLEFWFAARKTRRSTGDRIPQQFIYDGSSLANHPSLAGVERVIVWGAGSAVTTVLSNRFDSSKIAYFIDTDPAKTGTVVLGSPVRPPDALAGEYGCVVLIGSVAHEDAIRYRISTDFAARVARVVTLNELMVDPSGGGKGIHTRWE
jgi:hypothetical protein